MVFPQLETVCKHRKVIMEQRALQYFDSLNKLNELTRRTEYARRIMAEMKSGRASFFCMASDNFLWTTRRADKAYQECVQSRKRFTESRVDVLIADRLLDIKKSEYARKLNRKNVKQMDEIALNRWRVNNATATLSVSSIKF
jgi:flagellar biosynthesis chaperone FliJ